ncbi:hypothetical protein DPMN_034086 [Dreissena polymorpha]|uniref:Uncharacterized protein n=1 Tax=Dreissena polymorpha TaxID=45954 RepID=A0A9D4M7Y0_DREPO|nr:hypothetical protein DPMN_034086 [Dreissena polymorpha]
MRNNLIFSGIPEDNFTGCETPAVTERKLRDFLHEKMKIARETVDVNEFYVNEQLPRKFKRGGPDFSLK